MRSLGILSLVVCLTLAPPAALADAATEAAEKGYERAAAQAKREYDQKLEKAKADLIAQLRAAMQAATKRGDLDAGVAIRDRIAALTDAPAGAVPEGAVRKGKPKSLLPLVDAQKDATSGTWVVKAGVLYSDASRDCNLQLPYRPPAEYDLKVEFARLQGNNAVMQTIAAYGSQFMWNVGAWDNTVTGFDMVKGVGARENVTSKKAKAMLENGRFYVSLVKVRKDGVQGYIDGQLVSEWKTDYSDMSTHPARVLPDKKALGVGTFTSVTAFRLIEVTEITGTGEMLREAKPAAGR